MKGMDQTTETSLPTKSKRVIEVNDGNNQVNQIQSKFNALEEKYDELSGLLSEQYQLNDQLREQNKVMIEQRDQTFSNIFILFVIFF